MTQEEVWNGFYANNSRAWRGNTRIPKPEGTVALDLGCGNGKTLSSLIDHGYETIGLDFSSVGLESCRGLFPDCRYILADVRDIPLEDSSVDYVTAVHVLEHLDDGGVKRAVEEIRRILRDGGHVFVRAFTERDMRSEKRSESEIFYRYFDIASLERFFEGFETVSAELVEETTRFGTLRSRVECLFRKP